MVLWGEGKDRLWYFGEKGRADWYFAKKGRAALHCFGGEVPPHVLCVFCVVFISSYCI